MANKLETNYYFRWMSVLLLFLLLAFDRDLAMIYLLIMVADFIWFTSDNFISFPIRGQPSRFSTLVVYTESLAALGLFLGISSWLVGAFGDGLTFGTQSLFQLLATSTPILQGSQFLTLVGWGIVVPFIETIFFNGRLLEGLATYSEKILGIKADIRTLNLNMMIIVFVVAAMFTLFHLTAKGLASVPLLITFLFSVISSILVIRHRELRGAIFIHVVTNSLAVSSSLGWI